MFPARAGMSRKIEDVLPIAAHVPRASGDEPNPLATIVKNAECSPRERG